MTVKVTGVKEIQGNLKKVFAGMQFASIKGIGEAILLVKARSQRKTPVFSSNLKGSAATDAEVIRGNIVGFVGFQADYAVFVHEDLEARHTNGQAKFLESAALESIPDINRILARDLRASIR